MLEGIVANEKLFSMLASSTSGKVKAAFSGGVYIEISGALIMLHDIENGFIPFGIAIRNFSGRGKCLGLEPDMVLSTENSVLACRDADFCIKIYYEEIEETKTELDALKNFSDKILELTDLRQRSGLSLYGSSDLAGFSKSDVEDIFARAAYPGLSQLLGAMDENDQNAVESALEKLIGLGRGLTPSLDDFICGMLFVLHYSRRMFGISISYLDMLSDCVKKIAANNTSVYSAAYLFSAAAGEDFSILRECIENSSCAEFYVCLERLFKIGSSSGADMLCGMGFAANYILKQRKVTL